MLERGQIWKHIVARFSNYADRGKWLLVLDVSPSYVLGAVLTSRVQNRCPTFVELEAQMAVAVPNIVSLPREYVSESVLSTDRASEAELDRVMDVLWVVLGRAQAAPGFYAGARGDERKVSPYPSYEQWTVVALPEGYSHLAGLYIIISSTDFNRRYFRSQTLAVPLLVSPLRSGARGPLAHTQGDYVLEPVITETSAIDWRFYLQPCDSRFPRTANGKRRARSIASHKNPPNKLGPGASTVLPQTVPSQWRSRCLACDRRVLDHYSPWPEPVAVYPEPLREAVLRAVEVRLAGGAPHE